MLEQQEGSFIPLTKDDDLLHLFQVWQESGSDTVAESFVERGDMMLKSFLRRHDADIPDGTERRLLEMLKQVEHFGERYGEEGGGIGIDKKMHHMLATQIVPAVKDILRASARQKRSRGKRDFIPGRATEARDRRNVSNRQQISRAIDNEVAHMPEFSMYQKISKLATQRTLTLSDEFEKYSSEKEIIKRKIHIWKAENTDGTFGSTIARLQRQLEGINQTIERIQAQSGGFGKVDRSVGRPDDMPRRPWAKEGAQSPLRARGKSRSKSADLRLRGGVLHKIDPDEGDEPVDTPEKAWEELVNWLELILEQKAGLHADKDDIKTDIIPKNEEFVKLLYQTHPQLARLYKRTVESKLITPQTKNVKRHIKGLIRKFQFEGQQVFGVKEHHPDVWAGMEHEPGMVMGEAPAAPSVPQASPKKQLLGKASKEEYEDLGQIVSRSPDRSFLSYVVPWRKPKGDRNAYEIAYGVKARDAVDLYTTYHSQIDYPRTVQAILSVMSGGALKTDEASSRTKILDKPLPKLLMQVEKLAGQKRDWSGRTFRDILQKAVGGDINDPTHRQARQLIGIGKPSAKPRSGLQGDIGARSEAVRPVGLLSELYGRWRQYSGEAERTGWKNVDLLQFIAYHRGRKSFARADSAERGGSEFRAGVREAAARLTLDRRKLKAIGRLFDPRSNVDGTDPKFWELSTEAQLSRLGSKAHPNRWIDVLEEAFGFDIEKELKIKKGGNTSYSKVDRERLWDVTSNMMKEFLKLSGVNTAATHKQLAAYAAELSTSPSPQNVVRGKRKRQRSLSRLDEEGEELLDMTGDPQEEEKVEGGAAPKKRRKPDLVSALDIPPFPAPGSYARGRLGTHLHQQWQQVVGGSYDKTQQQSLLLEENIFKELLHLRSARRKMGNTQFVMPKLIKNQRQNDYEGFKTLLEKFAWNQYIEQLGDWANPQKRQSVNEYVRPETFFYREVFKGSDQRHVEGLLQKYLGARIFNGPISGRTPEKYAAKYNLKLVNDERERKTAMRYKELVDSYNVSGRRFPIPNWEDMLFRNHQYAQLSGMIPELQGSLRPATPARVRVGGGMPGVPKPPTAIVRPRIGPKKIKPQEIKPIPLDLPPAHTELGDEKQDQPEAPDKKAAREDAHLRRFMGGFGPRQDQWGPPPGFEAAWRDVGSAAPGFPGLPGEEADQYDFLMQMAGEAEVQIRNYFAAPQLPVRQHNNILRAEVVKEQNYEVLNGVHLLQTDNNIAPAMGAVHMVQPADNYNDKHFMHDMDGDINQGQKVLVEKSRRGPFRDQTGRSTVMDRSAHVTYRKRTGVFEITVRRGAIASEMQQLLSKLSAHRMSIGGSNITIIKGTKRYRLGPLNEINMRYLRELVEECIGQYGSCGLEITETRSGSGAIYRGRAHGARIKSKARR